MITGAWIYFPGGGSETWWTSILEGRHNETSWSEGSKDKRKFKRRFQSYWPELIERMNLPFHEIQNAKDRAAFGESEGKRPGFQFET